MVVSQPEDITPPWLTARLRASHALEQGAVQHVAVLAEPVGHGTFARTAALAVSYTPDATGPLPHRLFLKLSRPDLDTETLAFGQREIAFYRALDQASVPVPVPRCYDAAYDPQTGASHLLLDDLSPTHRPHEAALPLADGDAAVLVESLAAVHALWWESPRLPTEMAALCADMDPVTVRHRLDATVPTFMDAVGPSLLPWQRQLYERVLASALFTHRAHRMATAQGITLTHGDVHPGNVLLPRAPQRDRVILIDWHLWEIGVGMDDLAYLMAWQWSPQRRAALEIPLLRRYHHHVRACGVRGYPWSACWHDYRTAVALMTLVPIGQFRRRQPFAGLWSGLEKSTAAFRELKCDEVLTAG